MQKLEISVADIDAIIGQGYTAILIFTDTSSAGTFTTQDGTAALVAAQQGYIYVDTDGTAGTWYETAFFGSPGTGSKSDPFKGSTENYYCKATDVRQRLMASVTDDAAASEANDTVIWQIIDGVTRHIDNYKRVETGAYLAGSSTSQRHFPGSGDEWQDIDPCVSVGAVEVEETDGTWTAWTENTDFYTWPYNAAKIGEPIRALEVTRKSGSSKSAFTYGPRRVRVAAVYGISSSVPPDIKEAAIGLATRAYKIAAAGYADAAASVELGEVINAEAYHPATKARLDSAFPHTKSGI